MPSAVILDAVRTARGKRRGSLAGVHPMELAALVLKALERRNKLDAKVVDDVMLGCVTQVGEQGMNIGRGAVLAAGYPIEVAGATINRYCASGLQAVNSVAQAIMSDQLDVGIGGGVESMSRVPMGSDTEGGEGPISPSLAKRFPNLIPQGLSAEMIAEQWKLGRRELDEFAAASQQKAGAAIAEGKFKAEIEPVEVTGPDGAKVAFAVDEHCRPNTTPEILAKLTPSFKPDGVIHAGNSSGIVDGAAAVLLASKERARSLGFKPRARIAGTGVVGSDPILMLTGPIPAVQKALQRADLAVRDIDLWEINEAFAPIPIVVARELGIPMEKVNVNGGAIALGHPLGATGAILVATVLNELERRDLRRACITLCIGYGMGVATIIDRKID